MKNDFANVDVDRGELVITHKKDGWARQAPYSGQLKVRRVNNSERGNEVQIGASVTTWYPKRTETRSATITLTPQQVAPLIVALTRTLPEHKEWEHLHGADGRAYWRRFFSGANTDARGGMPGDGIGRIARKWARALMTIQAPQSHEQLEDLFTLQVEQAIQEAMSDKEST